MLATLACLPAAAQAAPGIAVAPTLPGSVTVGDVGVPASITVTATGDPVPFPLAPGKSIGICNNDPAPSDSGCDVIGTPYSSGIAYTPSCGQTVVSSVTAPACQLADKDVFRLSPTGVGASGTTCSGVGFNVVAVDAPTGMVKFRPVPFNNYVTLGAPGTECRINFTFDVLKTPVADADPATPGSQTRALASAGGWYYDEDADKKKKRAPLKAAGSAPITVNTSPCDTVNPPPECLEPPCPEINPPPECLEPPCPEINPPPECLPPPKVERMRAGLKVSCNSRTFSARVRVQGKQANLVRVLFLRDGRRTSTLTRPNKGLDRFVYKGSIKSLRNGLGKFKARVVVRKPGTFSRAPSRVYIRTARLSAPTLNARAEGCFRETKRPKVVRAAIRSEVGCLNDPYSVTVSTSGAARLVRRVQFKITGSRTRSLGRPNSGGDYVISGKKASQLPERASVIATVFLRRPGSFKRDRFTLRRTLRSGLQVQQKCKPKDTPGRR